MQTIFAPSPPQDANRDTAAAAAADLDAHTAAITGVQLTTAYLAASLITSFPYPPKNPIFYIKFRNQPQDLTLIEARIYQFIFDKLEKIHHRGDTHTVDSNADSRGDGYIPYIPRILYIIETETTAFIIIEFIHGTTLLQ